MAYSTDNPPRLLSDGIGGGDYQVWMYRSTDTATAVRVDGYITNATKLGMKAGDIVLGVDTDASPIAAHFYVVSAINANGSADLSDGTAIVATDSD